MKRLIIIMAILFLGLIPAQVARAQIGVCGQIDGSISNQSISFPCDLLNYYPLFFRVQFYSPGIAYHYSAKLHGPLMGGAYGVLLKSGGGNCEIDGYFDVGWHTFELQCWSNELLRPPTTLDLVTISDVPFEQHLIVYNDGGATPTAYPPIVATNTPPASTNTPLPAATNTPIPLGPCGTTENCLATVISQNATVVSTLATTSAAVGGYAQLYPTATPNSFTTTLSSGAVFEIERKSDYGNIFTSGLMIFMSSLAMLAGMVGLVMWRK